MCKVALCILFGCVVFSGSCICSENDGEHIVFTVNSENGGSVTHHVTQPNNVSDIRKFFILCTDSCKISMNGKDIDRFTAVNTVIENIKSASDTEQTKWNSLLCCFAWIGGQEMYDVDAEVASLCLQTLVKVCNKNYCIADNLLKSQCNDAYIPNSNADWRVICDAICLLKNNKNDDGVEKLIGVLKDTKSYSAVL